MTALTPIPAFGAEPAMSSLEIAELTGKRHPDVMRDIRRMFEDLNDEDGLSRFAHSYRNAQNKEQPCFRLPKDLTLTLCAGYSTPLRKKIIDRWLELEARPAQPVLTVSSCSPRPSSCLSKSFSSRTSASSSWRPK